MDNSGSGSYEIGTPELQNFFESIFGECRDAAYAALGDYLLGFHFAYDPEQRRAYCFQRQGLTFHYQFWNKVPSRAVADKLFAESPSGELPLPPELAERIYRNALVPD